MPILKTLAAGAAALAMAALWVPQAVAQTPGHTAEPIRIGVPLPLTGVLAVGGQTILSGVKFAAEEINAGGGLLGRPVELLIEDTKSEPNTAATIAAKMVTEDKVYAFVGGYGSTADFALLSSVKRYKPLFIHTGSSSVRLETSFGKEDWYYHIYIWDYHRQKAASRFLASVEPKVNTVALAYEDGLYGADAAKYAEEYFSKAGMKLVMKEPFKSGSPDFSPVLSRVKSLNPDAFFSVGYSGDNLQLVRQMKGLGIKPKLTMVVSAGDRRADYGDMSEGLTMITEWSTADRTPAAAELIRKVEAKGQAIAPVFPQGYAGMMTLADAIRTAGVLDQDKVRKVLSTATFDTPYGKIGYRASEGGGLHQLLSDETMVIVQHRKEGEEVVYPAAKAGGKLAYPAP
ncbi:amino acid ABC transporter substrate-binding protein [Azospirillum sp. HJ39]|uniref:amino acid ABC transporter substrate-binding protein n=1 Tax=Azospirillum sp. HJ39 TaxID=3159496 RepID=UPI0035569F40